MYKTCREMYRFFFLPLYNSICLVSYSIHLNKNLFKKKKNNSGAIEEDRHTHKITVKHTQTDIKLYTNT